MKVIANIKLLDGSIYESVVGDNLLQAEMDLYDIIKKEALLKIESPYGKLGGTDFIYGKYIMSFNLQEQE